MGYLDLSDRNVGLDGKQDLLVAIDAVVPWEELRPVLERIWREPETERKSWVGRRPMDTVVLFKALVLWG